MPGVKSGFGRDDDDGFLGLDLEILPKEPRTSEGGEIRASGRQSPAETEFAVARMANHVSHAERRHRGLFHRLIRSHLLPKESHFGKQALDRGVSI